MILFTLKKILRNKWMVFCLLVGCVVLVAVASSIPTYTNGIFRRMLIRDLEASQTTVTEHRMEHPGVYNATFYFKRMINSSSEIDNFEAAEIFDARVRRIYIPDIGLPVMASRKYYAFDRFYSHRRIETGISPLPMALYAFENIEDYIDMETGRMPDKNPDNDVIEFIMSKTDYQNSEIRFQEPFSIYSSVLGGNDEDALYGQAVLVGIFTPRDDLYWSYTGSITSPSYIMDYEYALRRFVDARSELIHSMTYYYLFDYAQIRTERVLPMLDALQRQKDEFGNTTQVSIRMEPVLRAHEDRIGYLSFMLITLEMPMLLMLVFYIYIVSGLMIRHERNEIAVLKSRGAKASQIFAMYTLQCFIVTVASFFIGLPLGVLVCRILGLSNGFMELVRRTALPLETGRESYIYALIAGALFMAVTTIPALRASRDTIVQSKRRKSRRTSTPFWQKGFIDVLLIGLSLYGLRIFRLNAEILELTGTRAADAPVNPLVLLAGAIFILGAGLLFLRIFPLFVRLLFMAGNKLWPPPLYSSLLAISRHAGSSGFLALFLVFNIGLGLFNATAARTLNRFLEDRIRYDAGADIVITQNWPSETISYIVRFEEDFTMSFERTYVSTAPTGGGPPSGGDPEEIILSRTQVKEPPFEVFRHLEGVQDATKVFRKEGVSVTGERAVTGVSLMGVIPHEFGRIAWSRQDLLPYHLREYMNIMTADPNAIFMSASMRDNHGYRVGDQVKIGWREQSNRIDCTVYGFVDYWPSISPVRARSGDPANFIIVNLNTIHRQMRLEPYSVWISMADGATSAALYESINEAGLGAYRLRDTSQELIKLKNDPLLQGLNGALTLGFLVTLTVTFIGFLIYWVLSLRERQLQFGILRAMGLSRMGLIATLACEQLLISGAAVAAGLIIGGIAVRLFIPTLSIMYSFAEQVPPFTGKTSPSDYTALLAALAAMLASGLAVLGIMVRRLKIDQVLKLGED